MNADEAQQRVKDAIIYKATNIFLGSIGENTSLNSVDFKKLIPDMLKIQNLNEIYLSNNNISQIPEEIYKLQNLTKLFLSYNRIRKIPKEIIKLKELKELSLSGNQISEIPSEICQMRNLQTLNLSYNQISDLPKEILQLKKLRELYLYGNKSLEEKFQREILHEYKNPQKIFNYYFKVKENETRPINEAKIVVIGEANVGKTSLINRLILDKVIPTSSTHGIEIRQWEGVRLNEENVRLNIWDFGGQELMHSTHQFFFTNRTIYILVINARENEDRNKVEEWLKRVESFGGDSPVIIVGNKVDENDRNVTCTEIGYFDIDRHELSTKFRNIKGFHAVCSDDSKIEDLAIKEKYTKLFDDFRKNILKEISKVKELHKPFPVDWHAIKRNLEDMQEKNIPYISYNQYIKNCIEENVGDELSQKTIVEFLNQIGTVIYFEDIPDTMVFNPEWITRGVYSVIDNPSIVRNKGELESKQLIKILDESEYPPEKHKFILNIMRKFELCVDIEPNRKFLIPDLLPLDIGYIGDWNDSLNIQFEYQVYLKNIFTQFIVRMFKYIKDHTYWRNGVILELENCLALVKVNPLEKKLTIQVKKGEFKKRQNLIAVIRHEIRHINSQFTFPQPEEYVAHPNYPEILEDYEKLVKMEHAGETEIFIKELDKKVPISIFLDGVTSREARRREFAEYRYINMVENQINISGSQIGAVGDKNKILDNTFNQQNNEYEHIDYDQLSKELRKLREFLISIATETEHYISIGKVANAEEAAVEKDRNKVIGYLKSTGKWVFDSAKEIGVDIVTDLIKKQIEP